MASQNFIARPALAVYNTGGGPAGDPYWDNVSLLLPFDGNDGDTTTTDLSSFSNTVSAFNGVARIESDQSKFGGTSLFTGTSGYNSVQISSSPSLDLNTGDWCVECWIRLTTLTFPASFAGVAGQSPRNGGPQFLIYFNGKVGWWWGLGKESFSGNTVLSTDTWYHVAWVRETASNTVKIYLNGVLDGSVSLSGSTSLGGTGDWYVGEARRLEIPFPGYIDDFRITKGITRYTENFTPPTEAFPTN